MCGRYYEDEKSIRSLETFTNHLEEEEADWQMRDVTPAQTAVVLCRENDHIAGRRMLWGFPGFHGKECIINARAESAMEKKMFRDSMRHRRCVIAAKGFYEWSKAREKYTFERKDSDVLFLAGCFKMQEGQERFVILTTQANASVEPVHDRMPLILEREEVETWILDDQAAEHLLHKTPVLLESGAEYEQLSFFRQ